MIYISLFDIFCVYLYCKFRETDNREKQGIETSTSLSKRSKNKCQARHTIKNRMMFKNDELNDYAKQLQQLGIVENDQQQKVLEFFYAYGKIIYKINVGNDQEEN